MKKGFEDAKNKPVTEFAKDPDTVNKFRLLIADGTAPLRNRDSHTRAEDNPVPTTHAHRWIIMLDNDIRYSS